MTFPSICDKKTPSFLASFKDIFDLMKKRNSHSASGKLVVKWPKNLTCVFLLLTLLNISVVISFIFLQLLFVLQDLVKFCIIQMCWCVLCYFDFLPFYCPLLSSSSFTIRAGSPRTSHSAQHSRTSYHFAFTSVPSWSQHRKIMPVIRILLCRHHHLCYYHIVIGNAIVIIIPTTIWNVVITNIAFYLRCYCLDVICHDQITRLTVSFMRMTFRSS